MVRIELSRIPLLNKYITYIKPIIMKFLQLLIFISISFYSLANIHIYQGIFNNKKIQLYIDDALDPNIATFYLSSDNTPPIALDLF